MIKEFSEKDFWRSIILYGLNTATYKIALGYTLINFAEEDENIITIDELAESFFEIILLIGLYNWLFAVSNF